MDRSTVLDFRLFCHHPPGSWPGGWIELIRRSIRLLRIVREYFRVGQDVYRSVLVAQAVQIGFDGVLGSLFFHNNPFTGMDGDSGIAHGFLQLSHVHSVRICRPGGQVDDLPGPLGNRPAIFITGRTGPYGHGTPGGLPGRRIILHLAVHRMVSLPACFPAFWGWCLFAEFSVNFGCAPSSFLFSRCFVVLIIHELTAVYTVL